MIKNISGHFLFLLGLLSIFSVKPINVKALPPEQEYYEIRVYHFENNDQEKMVDQYLKDALLPGLHRAGIKQIGVLKPAPNDTAATPLKIYVIIPYRSLKEMEVVGEKLDNDKVYQASGMEYINAPYNVPPYKRIEKTLVKAFKDMTAMKVPALTGSRSARIYELRSYEGATEKLHVAKVKMFNEGGEIKIFDRLGFNAVFYGTVLTGNALPNLMYLTTFDNKSARDEHWKAFFADAEWKKLSSEKQYEHTVSKSAILFLFPTEYSDY